MCLLLSVCVDLDGLIKTEFVLLLRVSFNVCFLLSSFITRIFQHSNLVDRIYRDMRLKFELGSVLFIFESTD